MLQTIFHSWERRLASVTTDCVVRPFEWGLDWLSPGNGHGDLSHLGARPLEQLQEWVEHVMADTDTFFTPPPTRDYTLSDQTSEGDSHLRFPSEIVTPHAENNIVHARLFSARRSRHAARRGARAAAMELGCRRPRRPVPVLPWTV